MILKEKIFKLKGKAMHYAWGGYDFIPDWLGIKNKAQQPFAEYWMGTHTAAPSAIITKSKTINLQDAIREMPVFFLGEKVYETFGELPYLFKILDVKDALSIQVHPTKTVAAKGFDAEDLGGKAITAPDRNYKDRNHKPEIMIALSEFWLLHGFLVEEQLEKRLASIRVFKPLQDLFKEKGYKALYKHVMLMPQADVDKMLAPLIKEALKNRAKLAKTDPAYWAARYYREKEVSNIDRGIFSIYFFNLLKLKKGEGIFQGAGLPHAYLEGKNIELMANSDNVLRAGLTPKHMDVSELIKNVQFKGITPEILKGSKEDAFTSLYDAPVKDFGIKMIRLNEGNKLACQSASPEMLLIHEGMLKLKAANMIKAGKGEVIFVAADTDYDLEALENVVIYKAFVPVEKI